MRSALAVALAVSLVGCTGSTGKAGPEGPIGPQGPPGDFTGNFTGNATIQGNLTVTGRLNLPLGEAAANPATSCAALLSARSGLPSDVYWLKPSSSTVPFQAYCDMVTEGGGWTLVWSNTRGGKGKPVTQLQWKAAINTTPQTRGAVSRDLESFNVYTGLLHWEPLAPAGLLRYDWAPNYGDPINQRYVCPFVLNELDNYRISFNLSLCTQPVGTVVPGLVSYSNNRPFSTYDNDNDADGSVNCSNQYSWTPWWYVNCWSGSLNGNGDDGTARNGAYWFLSDAAWGSAGGVGAGNGWLFVK